MFRLNFRSSTCLNIVWHFNKIGPSSPKFNGHLLTYCIRNSQIMGELQCIKKRNAIEMSLKCSLSSFFKVMTPLGIELVSWKIPPLPPLPLEKKQKRRKTAEVRTGVREVIPKGQGGRSIVPGCDTPRRCGGRDELALRDVEVELSRRRHEEDLGRARRHGRRKSQTADEQVA